MAARKREKRIVLDIEPLLRLSRFQARGAGTIQAKAIAGRALLHRVAEKFVALGYEVRDEVGSSGGGFHVVLSVPIRNRDMVGHTSEKLGPLDATFMGKVKLLSSPGKMACPGFNLPAGPPQLGGTCLGSIPGFPLLDSEQQQSVTMSKEAKALGPVRDNEWVCSGCYALKNNYIYANLQLGLEIRRLVAMDLMRRQMFVDTFEAAIVREQVKLVRQRDYLEMHGKHDEVWTIGDPAFFRIHDSGDFWSRAYLIAWAGVAERFQQPRELGKRAKIHLPAVNFWSPTRLWVIDEALRADDLARLPRNFVLRPSAMHFREAAPDLRWRGFANGSGVAAFGEDYRQVSDWNCPATMDPIASDRGVVAPKPKGLSEYEKGACNTSKGIGYRRPGDVEDAQPFGRGCRTCWLYPHTSVAYHEH